MLRSTVLALLLGSVTAASQVPTDPHMRAVTADSLGRFPEVEGTNLEGEHFRLPADFKGELNVVLVAFKREQQEDVDSWTPFLRTLAGRQRDLRVYELPTLGRRYRLMRPFIDGGMRRGIPDSTVRAATITLYIDKGPFRDALRLPTEDHIYVLLVDRRGRVLWRGEGRFTQSLGAALARRSAETGPAHGAGG